MNHSVLLKRHFCAYGFDLVFVSLVISVRSVEMIRHGRDCMDLAQQGQHEAFKAKCVRESLLLLIFFYKDPNNVGKSELSYPICCY